MAESTQEVAQDPRYARIGFPRGNPFLTLNGDKERDDLYKLNMFIEINNFDRIKENRTVVVFAPRGSGKSAVRVYLASDLAPYRPRSTSFGVELTNYDGILQKHANGEQIRADDYVDEIIRLGLENIFKIVFFSERNRPIQLKDHVLMNLGNLCATYHPDLLGGDTLLSVIDRHAPNLDVDFDKFFSALDTCQVRTYLESLSLLDNEFVALLARLIDQFSKRSKMKPASLKTRIGKLVELLLALNYKQLVVFIDCIDEMQETSGSPEFQVELLEPLLANLSLMECEGVCFKCFIPEVTRNLLLSRPFFRRDRLSDISVTVEWLDERLKELFLRRLKVFGGFDSFDLICKNKNDADLILDEMVRMAKGSPRWLIISGQTLLNETVSRKEGDLITLEDWQKAKEKIGTRLKDMIGREVKTPAGEAPQPEEAAEQEKPGILYIFINKPQMRINGELIDLSETEVNILKSIAARKDAAIEEEDLINEVWGDEKSVYNGVVDTNLNRIRKGIDAVLKKQGLIEKLGKSNKRYLIKKSRNIRLENFILK